MATQTGYLDGSEENDQGVVQKRMAKPYGSAFQSPQSTAGQADPFIDVVAKSKELATMGISPTEAINLATQMRKSQQNAAKAQVMAGIIAEKEKLLAADDQVAKLEKHNKVLDQYRNRQNALDEANSIDLQSIGAKQKLQEVQSKYFNTLNGPDAAISEDLQSVFKRLNETSDDYVAGVKTHLDKYGLTSVPDKAVDPKTGRVDISVIDEVGPAYFQRSQQDKLDEKLSQATKIAGAEQEARFTTQERLMQEKQKDPAYQQRMKDTKLKEIAEDESSVLDKFPRSVFSMNPKSEKDGSLVFEINKKRVLVNKDEYDSAKQKLKELESQKRGISQSIDMELQSSEGYSSPQAASSQKLTIEEARALANELGSNATRENLMDLARKRGYTF